MSNDDQIKKREAFINDVIKRMRPVIKEEIHAAVSDKVVPEGYERCPACGEVKKIDRPCPYCPKAEEETEPKDEIDGIVG